MGAPSLKKLRGGIVLLLCYPFIHSSFVILFVTLYHVQEFFFFNFIYILFIYIHTWENFTLYYLEYSFCFETRNLRKYLS